MTGIEIGRRYDATPLALPWPRCPHVLIGGETGAGKSGVINMTLGALADQPDVALCGVDLKLVELSPWRPRLTTLATTPGDADRLLVDLRNLIQYRASLLEQLGLRAWNPALGPWVVVVVDELAELQALDAATLVAAVDKPDDAQKALRTGKTGQQIRTALLGSLARLSRFCGVTIVAATQYPSAEVIDQQIRTQMTIRIMLRVNSGEQVNVVLGQGYATTVAPNSIPVTERGGCWIVGLPESPGPVRGRAHWASDDDITTRATSTAHLTPHPAVVFNPSHLTVAAGMEVPF
ncbi:MAG: FtsK/SpoIIIE domain-containing protein [Acidimicrobiales bacterium]